MIVYNIFYKGRKINKYIFVFKLFVLGMVLVIYSMVNKVIYFFWCYMVGFKCVIIFDFNRNLEDVIKLRIFRGNVILIFLNMFL